MFFNSSVRPTNTSFFSVSNNSNETDANSFQIVGPSWSFVPTYYIVVATASFLTNGTVMMTFLLKPSLRTPFNIYLINLVTANFIYACIESPADIINNLYSGWWLGSAYCSLYQYGTYILEAGIRVCHTLITVNRIWAVLWPHSYRQKHNRITACCICMGGWVYVHVNILPGFIMDILYYRLPLVENTCYLNTDAQWQWLLAMQVLVYGVALIVMVGAYPIIWNVRRKRRKAVQPILNGTLGIATIRASLMTGAVAGSAGGPSQQISLQKFNAMSRLASEDVGSRVNVATRKMQEQTVKRSSHAFRILTVLTIGVTISWTPILCYYTITIWMLIENPIFLQIAIVPFAMQSVVDPILFVSTLPDLRETFRGILCIR